MAKPVFVKTALDMTIAELAARADQKTLAVWACDCVERVMPFFDEAFPDDDRPHRALEAARQWVIDGVFRMAAVRKASLSAHKAASAIKNNDAARAAARASGHAIATAHVPRHALGSALYAASAVRDGTNNPDVDAAVLNERHWQYHHLLDLLKRSKSGSSKRRRKPKKILQKGRT